MNLKNNLYDIVSRHTADDGTAVYTLRLNPASSIYAAHFPGMPVTPGVCLLQMGRELLEDRTGRGLCLTEVKNAKFLSVVSPADGEALVCAIASPAVAADGAGLEARIEFRTATGTKAKMSVKCKCR